MFESINTNEVRVKEIYPHIYHIEFRSSYDLAMHFLRFQEYYESPTYHQKFFTLVDYMEWYAKVYNKNSWGSPSFTYPADWAGFNIPSRCLLPFIAEPCPIPDINKYDVFMTNLIRTLKRIEGETDFYLIGTQWLKSTNTNDSDSTSDSDDSSSSDDDKAVNTTLHHELSHAWYTVDPEYRKQMDALLALIPLDMLEKARKHLMANNYHTSTVDDEIVAYSATGLHGLHGIISPDIAIQFKEIFQKQLDKANMYKNVLQV